MNEANEFFVCPPSPSCGGWKDGQFHKSCEWWFLKIDVFYGPVLQLQSYDLSFPISPKLGIYFFICSTPHTRAVKE